MDTPSDQAQRDHDDYWQAVNDLAEQVVAEVQDTDATDGHDEVLHRLLHEHTDQHDYVIRDGLQVQTLRYSQHPCAALFKDVVHIDECHELAKPYQTALYRALDKREILLSGGGKSGSAPQTIPLGDFTLLLSTTDEFNLLQPLRDRMRLLLRFDFYSDQELATVLLQRSRALRWEVHEELLPFIAQRAKGTPRLALRLLLACRRVCRAGGETTITAGHLERACALEQIDALGLGPVEQKYLQVVSTGASRLNVVASMLGLPGKTVSEVVEPFLLRAGLLGRARFYQLIGSAFPFPVYDVRTHRPIYVEELQKMCLQVRRLGLGFDGQPVVFNSKRRERSKPPRRAVERVPTGGRHDHLLNSLRALGLSVVKEEQVEPARVTSVTPAKRSICNRIVRFLPRFALQRLADETEAGERAELARLQTKYA